MKVIELKNVSKSFNLKHEENNLKNKKNEEFYALKDISFNVNKGETLGIIGENGSGKTTLLKIIAGILKPSSGKINVRGKIMSFIELGAGLQPELTGRENIFLYGSLLGIPKEEIKSKVNQIIEFSGLNKFIDAKFKTYSTGMQMRLVFSTAMMNDPDILLIDEIIAVGDEFFQKKSFNKIRQLKEQGKTIIFVSHSMEQIKRVCDRAVFLGSGKIKKIGLPEEVIPIYLENFYKIDDKSIFKKINERINKISKLEKNKEIINNLISKTNNNVLNRFKIKNLKNNLEKIKFELSDLRFCLYDEIENYESILEEKLNSKKHELDLAYVSNDKKKIKKLENEKYDIIENFKKFLFIKIKFCSKKEIKNIKERLISLMEEQSNIFRGTKKELDCLKNLNDFIEKEIKETKNHKFRLTLSEILNDNITRIFYLDTKNKYGVKILDKENKRKKIDDNNSLDLVNILREEIISIDNDIFNLELTKEDYLIANNKNKAVQCKNEICNLKQKRKKIINEMNKKQKEMGNQRKDSDIKIYSVRILGSRNNETKNFETGDKLKIEINYKCFKRIDNPVFGVAIFKDDCTHITGPNTKFHHFNIDFIKGKGQVYYTIDSLPLLEGDYLVTVAIHPYNSFIPYDVHTRLYSFKVIKNHIQDFGTFYINAKWEIKKN